MTSPTSDRIGHRQRSLEVKAWRERQRVRPQGVSSRHSLRVDDRCARRWEQHRCSIACRTLLQLRGGEASAIVAVTTTAMSIERFPASGARRSSWSRRSDRRWRSQRRLATLSSIRVLQGVHPARVIGRGALASLERVRHDVLSVGSAC